MWSEVEKPWKEAFALAWESFRHNTIPIGAVIVDEYNNIISKGRNMIFDKITSNCLAGTTMAHAEMSAMIQLKREEHPNIRRYTLYTTMEPCPMCFCTMVLMNIRNLKYASRDGFGGATELNDKIEYIRNKNTLIEKAHQELEVFLIALQTAYEYGNGCTRTDVFDKWRTHCDIGVELGKGLYEEAYFKNEAAKETEISIIFDDVITRYKELININKQLGAKVV